MSGLASDLRHAFRSLRRSPGVAAATVLMLGAAAGASIALFSIVKGALLDPWPYEAADRIVTTRASFPRLDQPEQPTFSVPEIVDLEGATEVFEHTVAGVSRNFNLTGSGRPERLHAVALTASSFPMLGVAPLLGRAFRSSEDVPGGPRVAVLSHRLWQGRFGGDPNIVGRAIEVEGEPYTVVGVMPRRFVFWDAQIYFPLALDRGRLDRSDRGIYFQGRLRPGVTVARAEAALEILARRLERQHGGAVPEYAGFHFRLVPLQREVLRDVRPALLILFGAVGFVLTIACANISNLLLARAAARDREIAVRIALGAGRSRILRYALAEGLVLGAAAAAVGLGLAVVAVPAVLRLIPYGYIPAEADPKLDGWAAAYGAAICFAAGIFFGLLPAARWRRSFAAIPQAGVRATADRGTLLARRLFLASQIALAVAVTSSSALLVQGFRRLLAMPSGFRSEGVATLRVALPRLRYASEDRARDLLDRLTEAVRSDPTVASAGAVSSLPLEGATPSRRLEIEGRPAEAGGLVFDADLLVASPGYVETLGLPVLAGRAIAATDAAAVPPVAVVNRALATRFFPRGDAVGRRLRISGAPEGWRTIVGVVGDLRQRSLDQPPRPALFLPLDQSDPIPRSVALAVAASGGAEASAAAVRSALSRLDPEIPVFAVEEMGERVSDSLAGRRLAARLLFLLAVAAVGLAAFGSGAVAAYDVARRRREIGIRMALGAAPRRIAAELMTRSARTAGLGLAGGLALALAASRALSAMLPGAASALPAAAGGAVLLGFSVLLASALPARRAARIDPAISLRSE